VVTIVNPADGQPLDTLALACAKDLEEVLASTERGFQAWRRVPAHERCARLERAAVRIRERTEHIATLLTLEQGKPLAEARMDGHHLAASAAAPLAVDQQARCAVRCRAHMLRPPSTSRLTPVR
jgi:acyl-CoA reductase-like NAD-dependent aldehyde dehydrogenase